MARRPNQTGTRRTAIRLLNTMTDKSRSEMLAELRTQFPKAAEEYIKSLWATFRSEAKENGTLIEVFSVKDIKDGKACAPFLKSEYTFHPAPDDCLTAQLAKNKWVLQTKSKIAKVKQL